MGYELDKKGSFDAFVEEYKTKSLLEKQGIIINDLKEIIALVQDLCAHHNIEYDLLMNREILDINKENYTQDDFAEAVFVYLQMYKELLSSFLVPILSLDEE